jgi:hypothetical protein
VPPSTIAEAVDQVQAWNEDRLLRSRSAELLLEKRVYLRRGFSHVAKPKRIINCEKSSARANADNASKVADRS